jgi:hypothetical protein
MLRCLKCRKRMFIDRTYSSPMHLESYCLTCGYRKFFNPPQDSEEGRWLIKKEQQRAKATMSQL